MRRLLVVAMGMMMVLAHQAWVVPTLTTGASLHTGAGVGVGFIQQSLQPTALPFNDTSTATGGGSTSSTTYNLTTDGFDFSFDHVWNGNDSAAVSSGYISFAVSQDTIYDLTGSYALTGELIASKR